MLVTLLLGLLMGLVLGLLGGGGSILAVPILLHAAHLPTREAIATSLLVVSITSMFSAAVHAKAGRVRWDVAGWFGGAGMAGAGLGGFIAHGLPTEMLLSGFVVVMVVAALSMLRKRPEATQMERPSRARLMAIGGAVGLLTGLVGAGGGFVIVPALVLLAGLGMAEAGATSAAIIAVQALAGFAAQASGVQLNWAIALPFAAVAAAGAIAGARFAHRVAPERLRRGFAILVLVVAARMAFDLAVR